MDPVDAARSLGWTMSCWPRWAATSSTTAARAAWAELVPDLHGRHVVLLGARLAEVAGLGLARPISRWGSWLTRDWCGAGAVAVIPHPSGLNRLYNEASTREAASECLRTARVLAGPVPR